MAAILKKRVYLEIAEWLARDRGIAATLEGTIEHETPKAVLIGGVWIPRSAIRHMEVLEVVHVDAGPQLRLRGGQLLWSCPFERNYIARDIPSGRWDAEAKAWRYPASPAVAAEIIEAAGLTEADVQPEVWQLAEQYWTAHEMRQLDPTQLPAFASRTEPWRHQKTGFWFTYHLPAVGLFMDMGSGKTKVVVDIIVNRNHRRVLVVCPKSALYDVWERQVPAHSAAPVHLAILDAPSTAKKVAQAKQAIADAGDRPVILVTNYESVWRDPLGDWLLEAGLDLVVLDESHRIKSPGSKVSLYCQKLGRAVPYRLCLTGTPAHNSPLDIYAQYRFLDPGIFGTNFARFKERYAVLGGYTGKEVVSFKNLDDLQRRMYMIAYRVRTEDVIDLPPEIDEERRFDLSKDAGELYERLFEEFVVDVKGGMVTADNALTRLLRLQQITSGFLPAQDPDDPLAPATTVRVDTGKEELLEDVLTDIPPHEPVVVFYRFDHDARVIEAVCRHIGRPFYEVSGKRKQILEWKQEQVGEGRPAGVVAVQVRAGEAGIDLSRACYCIYYSLGFSLGDYHQSRRRVNRPGQTRSVRYYHLIANGTVDERVYRLLKNKQSVVQALIDEIRGERK